MSTAPVKKTQPVPAGAPVLALDGGARVRDKPLPPWPAFESDEIEAVTAVLRSGKVNYWTGDECNAFEKEFAHAFDRRYAVALANGSVALELALHVLGIEPGDEVVVPARSFMATASCVVLRGARPVFADIDALTGNITADTIAPVLTDRTRAVIAVHIGGWPCDMDPIVNLARTKHLRVVEDCAQSHGATYRGRLTGSIGDIGIFSFCQDKIMTTGGEGGMLVTDDESTWKRAWSYKDHGKSYEAVFERQHPPGFRWLHESFGTNWRMTEMQAAIGRRQLRKLPDWIAARRAHARILDAELEDVPGVHVGLPLEHEAPAYYKYYVLVDPARLALDWSRERIIDAISAEGIPCISGSCSEMYLEKAFQAEGLNPPRRLPAARKLGETSLMLMLHPTMSDDDMRDTAAAVRKVMQVATAR